MREYKFIEHTADIAVDVRGDSYEELFTASAEAFAYSTAPDLTPAPQSTHSIEISSQSHEELLVEFLNELNYLVEVRKQIYTGTERIAFSEKDNIFTLSAEVKLNRIGPEDNLENEIKAITYHQMKIEFKDGFYSTRIVFDI